MLRLTSQPQPDISAATGNSQQLRPDQCCASVPACAGSPVNESHSGAKVPFFAGCVDCGMIGTLTYAVIAESGWSPEMNDGELLAKLLELNLKRAEEEGK